MEKENIVKTDYNKIGKQYQDTRIILPNIEELKRFINLLPKNVNVLDAGCGTGLPAAKFLSDLGVNATGIDFSDEMLRLAKENVPKAIFEKQNMTKLDFPDNSFDGLISLYVIIHIPREKHRPLFQQIHKVLKPDGIMLVTMACSEWEEIGEFCGERMFWSHYKPETSLQIIKESGFTIIQDWFDSPYNWFSNDEKHYWILACNSK